MIRRILNKIESIYKHRYFSKNEKGAYNFLVQKVYKSTDIDFIENVWKLDYFRQVLKPQELKIDTFKRVLVLAPHQDDESIGCGGTLTKLATNGCEITIVFLTDGAELSNPINSIPARRKEAKAVCEKLNATMLEIGIDNISMDIKTTHLEKLKIILDQGWDMIFTVWPVDQPPKHRLCSYMFGKVLRDSNYKGNISMYAVHTDLIPNFYVDISEEIIKKQELLALYPSQMNVQSYHHLSKGLDAWRSRYLEVSSKERFIETFFQIPSKEYKSFQNIYEKSDTNKLFKSHEACITTFNKLKTI
jgi:LmbE family N-acetylglucosaminyl deacetylase